MQTITPANFQKSVFNIGAGKDINPLNRFAYTSDTDLSKIALTG